MWHLWVSLIFNPDSPAVTRVILALVKRTQTLTWACCKVTEDEWRRQSELILRQSQTCASGGLFCQLDKRCMTEPLSASADLCGFISCAPVPCLMVRKGLVVLWDNFSPKHTPAPIPKPLCFCHFVWCHHPSSEFNHICVLGRTFAILCQDEKYVCSCLIFPKAFRPVQQCFCPF